jgi:hypothetical protein
MIIIALGSCNQKNFNNSFSFSNDGQEFGGALYQKVNSNLETGVQLAWTAGSNATRFGLGCKYQLDDDSAVRAKINNASQLGLGYQQKLRQGMCLKNGPLNKLVHVFFFFFNCSLFRCYPYPFVIG